MFWFVLMIFLPMIFGLVVVGIFIALIVKLISFLVNESKKESMKKELEFKEKSKVLICEYCGSHIKKTDNGCPACGAKLNK